MKQTCEREGLSHERKVGKCPKCSGEMEEGKALLGRFGFGLRKRGLRDTETIFLKKGDVDGDSVSPFYCKNCGYIELYKELEKKKKWT